MKFKKQIRHLLLNSFVQNVILLCSLFLFYRFTGTQWATPNLTSWNTLLSLLPVLAPVYFVNLFIVRVLILKRKRIVTASILIISVVFFSATFQFHITKMWGAYSYGLLLNFLTISTGIGLYLMKHSFYRLQQESLTQQLHLKQLKAQINPHFLFNTLNALYNDSRSGKSSVPDTILMLSDLMRYLLEAEQKEKVSLKEELDFIEHYVFLEKQRANYPERILLDIYVENENLTIPAFLFLPLIENGFKHGIHNATEPAELSMQITERNRKIMIAVSNANNSNTNKTSLQSGIGLETLRKRLDLLFPKRHIFETKEQDNVFSAKLEIEI